MSSHHVVREKQEPALLILSLNNFSYELLGQLLEWSPTVIATDETIQKLVNDQIKVDWLITGASDTEIQSDIKTVISTENIFNTALEKLIGEGYPAVNIITDDSKPDEVMSFANKIDIVIYRADKKIYPVKSGFSKWKPAGDSVEIINTPDDLTYQGLKKSSDKKFVTISDGFFTLQFSQAYLFLAEEM